MVRKKSNKKQQNVNETLQRTNYNTLFCCACDALTFLYLTEHKNVLFCAYFSVVNQLSST